MANDDSPVDTQLAEGERTELKPNGNTPDHGLESQVIAVAHKITTSDGRDLSRLYDESYYRTGCGPIPYSHGEPWLAFFSNMAEHIIRSLRPHKVLDAGCAMGLLVEALWDRGVEAWGIDISPYAISQVRRDIKHFCTLGSVTDPIDAQFDLVVCIEVIEHIPAEYERTVIGNLCSATSTILFSSTPTDITEATHFNVRPTIYWLKLFSEFGFWPDLLYDADFVAPHAMLLKKSEQQLPGEMLSLSAEIIRQKLALCDRDNRIRPLEEDLQKSRTELAESLERQAAVNSQLAAVTARLDETLKDREQLNSRLDLASARLDETLKDREQLNARLDLASARLQTLSVSETSLREEAAGLKQQLNFANRQLSEISASPGWRVIQRYRTWVSKQRRAHPRLFGRYERFALRMLRRMAGQQSQQSSTDREASSGAVAEPDIQSEKYPRENTSKFLLIISGGPSVSSRYRADHQAEELGLLGLTVDTALFDAVDYDRVLGHYSAFVLHRVPGTAGIEGFIKRAKASGKPVIFDTDDLVFNEKYIGDMRAIRDSPLDACKSYIDGIRHYYRTLSFCDAALVSTEDLRDRVKELFPEMPVYVNRNAVSDEMVRQADFALKYVPKPDDGLVRIIYMSGTHTHNVDFDQCVAALDRLLQARPQVRLMIVGFLDLPERIRRWTDRLEVTPLIPWQELPELMRRADINLAPLELENAFTYCKSELKYFEAGLLELPTVASQVPAFQIAITPGGNGFLCRSDQDWFDAIEQLVLSPALRHRIGSRARQDVLARYTTRSRALELTKALRQIFNDLRISGPRRLSIAIVSQAPIAQTGGGYKNIFTLANKLADRGHDVHIYVEGLGHLSGMTDSEIVAFCHRYFGRSAAQIHVGHDQILPSDIAIATAYPTAYTVNNLINTKCKAYLIQDFEPDFFDTSTPAHERAERTYDLPLKKIALGKYLQTLFSKRDRVPVPQVPFSLNLSIFRNLRIRQQSPIRVLFFARPNLKRRAYPVGVEALRILAHTCPEVEIAFYGMSEPTDPGFAYQNLGELSPEQVAQEMNRSHIHLSFSLTNISWVPFEAMACGCAVVEAKVPSVELWMEDETASCVLVEPNRQVVADALIKLVKDSQMRDRIAASGERYVASISATWEESCEQFEKILLEALFADNSPAEGALIASRSGGFGQKIFFIEHGKRRWLRDPQSARAGGLRIPENPQLLSDDEIARLPLAGDIPRQWTAADRKSPPADGSLREIAASGLTGSGIEFGAGDSPFPIPAGCKVRYADRLSRDAFAVQYHPREHIDAVTPDLLTGLCEMEGVSEESLDFVIASHVLEHTPNPLLAFRTAYSRLKPGGQFVLVLPDKRYTFDKERALTTLDHLILDYDSPSAERDRQHLEEWHTKVFPAPPGQLETLLAPGLNANADIHYHTWTYESFGEMVDYVSKNIAPWSRVWSHPGLRDTEKGIEFYFVLTK